MKIAHLSDPHITSGPALKDQAEDLNRIVSEVLKGSPDIVMITGDLYGRAVPHKPSPIERATLEQQLIRLAECAPVYVVKGNHDHEEAFELLSNLGGTYPVTPLSRAGSKKVYTPGGAAMLYWMAYPNKNWLLADEKPRGAAEAREHAIGKIDKLLELWATSMRQHDLPVLFMGHFQVTGAQLASGEVISTGEIEISRHRLAALPVAYGALGHIHKCQHLDRGIMNYAGSPWVTEFGDHGEKGWIEFDTRSDAPVFRNSNTRRWVTLRYRWAGEWVEYPEEQDLKNVVVRARLTVPDVHVASCPWKEEISKLKAVAHRVKHEKIIEPTIRVRAPEVAASKTIPDKLESYWNILETSPTDQLKKQALSALNELQTMDDDQVKQLTDQITEKM